MLGLPDLPCIDEQQLPADVALALQLMRQHIERQAVELGDKDREIDAKTREIDAKTREIDDTSREFETKSREIAWRDASWRSCSWNWRGSSAGSSTPRAKR